MRGGRAGVFSCMPRPRHNACRWEELGAVGQAAQGQSHLGLRGLGGDPALTRQVSLGAAGQPRSPEAVGRSS